MIKDEIRVLLASKAADRIQLSLKEIRANLKFDFPTSANAATSKTEAWWRKHVTLIVHTMTTQLTRRWSADSPARCHTSLSTTHLPISHCSWS